MVGRTPPLIDCNVHLWDQTANPILWLTDRALVRDMLGDYDSLPDTYTLADYQREVAGHDVRGIVWSDAGATIQSRLPLGCSASATSTTCPGAW